MHINISCFFFLYIRYINKNMPIVINGNTYKSKIHFFNTVFPVSKERNIENKRIIR